MGFYAERIQPRLIAAGMQNKAIAKHRPRIPGLARGRVLEIGMGSGLNIPWYPATVERLYGLEPSARLREFAAGHVAAAPFPVEVVAAGAESIPLPTASLDTVVSTWTLCSIPELERALAEIRRVLKPDGRLLFLEHGRAPDPGVARWQDRLAPVFRGLAGCSPNLPIDELISESGFRFAALERTYLEGPRFIAWHFIGQAAPM